MALISLGLLYALTRFPWVAAPAETRYRRFRQDVGRGILLGLECLVAADIIRTVAVAPTLQNALVPGVIVLIRTFLSMALQVELEGHWPWQREEAAGAKKTLGGPGDARAGSELPPASRSAA